MPDFLAALAAAAEAATAMAATQVVGAITVGNIIGATVLVGSAMDQRRRARNMAADARRAYLDNLTGRDVMLRTAIAPRTVTYGRDRVSGPIVDAFTSGDNQQYLHLIVAISGRQIDAVEALYFNEQELPAPDGDGFITDPAWCREERQSRLHSVTVPAGGSVTLPHAAVAVDAITKPDPGEYMKTLPVTGWAHTAGSDTITGLVPGEAIDISYQTSQLHPRVRWHAFTGAPGQTVPPALLAETGGRRTAAHSGQGVAWLWVRLEWDQQVFGQIGVPNISARIRGALVRDPRTGLTAWSDNAALCAADFVVDQALGLRCPASTVPDAELIAQANICDELVELDGSATPATQKRYTVNGTLSAGDGRLDSFDALCDAMAGFAVWAQGRWVLRAGAHPTPEPWTLTEDHLAGAAPELQRGVPRRDLVNAVAGIYRDPSQGWAEVQAPPVLNATYQAQDGGRRITRTVKYPMVTDAMRAQRLARIQLERARQAVTVTLECSLRAYDLLPGQVVPVSLARYGWAGKLFEVRRRSFDVQRATVRYVLRETAAAVWEWTHGMATEVDPAPDTMLPDPLAAPPFLLGLTCASGTPHLQLLRDGTIEVRGLVSWTAVADAFVTQGGRVEVQWRRSDEVEWQSAAPVPGDATSTYIQPLVDGSVTLVRARCVNAAGRHGRWSYFAHSVSGKSAAPSNVAGLSAVVAAGVITWSWTPCPDLDYAVTELRTGGTDWATATPQAFVGTANVWQQPVDAAGDYTVRARHRDTTGNESNTAVAFTISVAEGDLGGGSGAAFELRSTALAFTFDGSDLAAPAGQTIVFAPTASGVTWEARRYDITGALIDDITASLGVSGLARTLAVATFGVAAYCVVKITKGSDTDQVTVHRLRDGASSIAGYLTNEAHAVATAADGSGGSFTGAGGTFRVFRGLTDVTTSGTVTYSVVGSSGAVGASISAAGVYAITGMSADVATVQLRAVVAGVTIDKVFTVTRSKAGLAGLNVLRVMIYQRSTTGAPSVPSGVVTVDFAAGGTVTGLNNGWSSTIPAGTGPLYVAAATAASTTSSDNIFPLEWSSPVILAQDGSSGLNAATVYLYQRSNSTSAPAVPASSLTYTFATGVLSGTLGAWSQSVPPAGSDKYLYVTTAAAVSSSATDTILTSEWSSVQRLAADGDTGATGRRGPVRVAWAVASQSTLWSYGGAGSGGPADTAAAAAIAAATGGDFPWYYDECTLYVAGTQWSETRYIYPSPGVGWTPISGYLSGDALVADAITQAASGFTAGPVTLSNIA